MREVGFGIKIVPNELLNMRFIIRINSNPGTTCSSFPENKVAGRAGMLGEIQQKRDGNVWRFQTIPRPGHSHVQFLSGGLIANKVLLSC